MPFSFQNKDKKWGFVVSVHTNYTDDNSDKSLKRFCTGSILTKNLALTAANCITHKNWLRGEKRPYVRANKIVVISNSIHIEEKNDKEKRMIFHSVDMIIPHPEYDGIMVSI